MEKAANNFQLSSTWKLLFFAFLLFTSSLKASDSLSVNDYLNDQILSDSTGLLTVLKQNSQCVFSPIFFSQNNEGLSLRLTPQFTLSNWYDDVVLSKVNKDEVILSDSSITRVNYLYGFKDSHEFLASYSDKLGNTYMNLIFDRSASVSRFSNSDVKNIGFLINFLNQEGKYRFRYGFAKNSLSFGENGGLSDTLAYLDALELTVFTVPVELYSARNTIEMADAYVGNQFVLNYKDPRDTVASDTTFPRYLHTIGYDINLQKEEYIYSMDKQDIDSAFFDTTFISLDETWDSLGFSKMGYKAYYQLLDSSNRNIFKLSYSSSIYDWTVLNQSYITADFNNYQIGKLSVMGKYNLKGIWKEGYKLSVSHDSKLFRTWLSSFKYELNNNLPGYFYMKYHGNHFNWSNSFGKVRNQSVSYSLYHKPSFTGVETHVQVLDNWIYLDTMSIPVQLSEQVQYFNFGVFNNFRSKYFNVYTKLSYQNANSEVIRFPTYNLRNVFTYNFKLGRLNFSTGYMFSYFTSFVGLDYNPNLRRTYLQEDEEVGGIPLLDVFATVKIGEADVFIKGENILFESVSRAYYLYPNRPVLPRYIRIGFSWNFKN